MGPEDQSSIGRVYRDGEEETGKELPRLVSASLTPTNVSQVNCVLCVFVSAARSVKATGIGRLLVTILEATELKAAKPNGETRATGRFR